MNATPPFVEVVILRLLPVEVVKENVGPKVWLIVEVAGAERIYPGLVQLKESAPVEVVKEIPTPEVATVKVFPRTPARVVVAGAERIYPGFVHEKESAPVDVV